LNVTKKIGRTVQWYLGVQTAKSGMELRGKKFPPTVVPPDEDWGRNLGNYFNANSKSFEFTKEIMWEKDI